MDEEAARKDFLELLLIIQLKIIKKEAARVDFDRFLIKLYCKIIGKGGGREMILLNF